MPLNQQTIKKYLKITLEIPKIKIKELGAQLQRGGVNGDFGLNLSKKARLYSSLATQQLQIKLNPYFITGFSDGEGSFVIIIRRNSKFKIG